MEALIVLATIMALFGVIGYLRGAKSSLFTALVIWVGLVLITQFGSKIATTINGLVFAVVFVLSGGLAALGGGGDRAAALDEVLKKMPDPPKLVNPDGTGIGIIAVFVLLAVAGFLLGMLKIFKSKSSVWGLLIGLVNGYVLSAYLLPRILPEAGLRLPLPGRLAWPGAATAGSGIAAPSGPSLFGALIASISRTLSRLVEGGQIALLIAILIVLFVLLATRLGNRKK